MREREEIERKENRVGEQIERGKVRRKKAAREREERRESLERIEKEEWRKR